MAKDVLGNIVKVGNKVLFNGSIYEVKAINENRLLGGHIQGNKGMGIKIPDSMTLEMDIQYDADKPVNFVVCREPSNNEGEGIAKPN